MNQTINKLDNFNNRLNLDTLTSREILEEVRQLCIILNIVKDISAPAIFYRYNNLYFVDDLAIYYNKLYRFITFLPSALILIIDLVARIPG